VPIATTTASPSCPPRCSARSFKGNDYGPSSAPPVDTDLILEFQHVTRPHLIDRRRSTVQMPDAPYEEQRGQRAVGRALGVGEHLDAVGRPPALASDQHLEGIRVHVERQSRQVVGIVRASARHQPIAEHGEEMLTLVDPVHVRQAGKNAESFEGVRSLQVRESVGLGGAVHGHARQQPHRADQALGVAPSGVETAFMGLGALG